MSDHILFNLLKKLEKRDRLYCSAKHLSAMRLIHSIIQVLEQSC